MFACPLFLSLGSARSYMSVTPEMEPQNFVVSLVSTRALPLNSLAWLCNLPGDPPVRACVCFAFHLACTNPCNYISNEDAWFAYG